MEDRLATSLILLCAAATRLARTGGFPATDEPLDEGGRRDAAQCRLPARFQSAIFVSPARAAVETSAAMGLSAKEESALMDGAYGIWAGRSFDEIASDALGNWLADPVTGTPGGETMAAVQERAASWLDSIAISGMPATAITHATLIRAALSHALGLPPAASLRIDIAPLSHARLSFNGVWRLQAIGPLS